MIVHIRAKRHVHYPRITGDHNNLQAKKEGLGASIDLAPSWFPGRPIQHSNTARDLSLILHSLSDSKAYYRVIMSLFTTSTLRLAPNGPGLELQFCPNRCQTTEDCTHSSITETHDDTRYCTNSPFAMIST